MYDADSGPELLVLNTLFASIGIDPQDVIVIRHGPRQAALRRVLPWLAVERHDLFNLYQSVQGGTAGRSMGRAQFLAVFIGLAPGEATFAGLYRVTGSRPLAEAEFRALPGLEELLGLGMLSTAVKADERLLDLVPVDTWAAWVGKLTIKWPGKELSWWRRAERNRMAVSSIAENSRFAADMPGWAALMLTWTELRHLPSTWRAKLAEWRGIYFIYDIARRAGYVGSASGAENLLGRWLEYARTGHGGNVMLRASQPENLRFSILQRTSPDMTPAEVVAIEETWKLRLHTRTHGLNG